MPQIPSFSHDLPDLDTQYYEWKTESRDYEWAHHRSPTIPTNPYNNYPPATTTSEFQGAHHPLLKRCIAVNLLSPPHLLHFASTMVEKLEMAHSNLSNVIIHGGTFNSAQGNLHIHNRYSQAESGTHDFKSVEIEHPYR